MDKWSGGRELNGEGFKGKLKTKQAKPKGSYTFRYRYVWGKGRYERKEEEGGRKLEGE